MPTPPDQDLWIVIGDIHENADNIARIPELRQARGIIISGDLTNTGGIQQAKRIMGQIEAPGLPVLAQIGNMDREEVDHWLSEQGINIHCQVRELAPDAAVMGIGGSTYTPFATPSEFPESAFATWLEEMWPVARKYPHTILVSHTPPKDTVCDDIGGGTHVGSEAVRDFIMEAQPDVCVCGHIHEGIGMDRIGRTVVVNPGQLSQGGYALLRAGNGKVSVTLARVAD